MYELQNGILVKKTALGSWATKMALTGPKIENVNADAIDESESTIFVKKNKLPNEEGDALKDVRK